jgi:hypothetical protein
MPSATLQGLQGTKRLGKLRESCSGSIDAKLVAHEAVCITKLKACARALQKLASVTQACSDNVLKGQAQSNADVGGGYAITAQKLNISALR